MYKKIGLTQAQRQQNELTKTNINKNSNGEIAKCPKKSKKGLINFQTLL